MTPKTILLRGAAAAVFWLAACDSAPLPSPDGTSETVHDIVDSAQASTADLAGNPLLQDWDTPYGAPPFSTIEDVHYMPSVDKGIADLEAQIAAIADL